MPRRIFTLISKKNQNEYLQLNSLSYELALEEALDKLGWSISEDSDEVYKNIIYQDEHAMSIFSQKNY